MIKLADVLFLPAAFVATVAIQLGMWCALAPLMREPQLLELELLVAGVVLALTYWWDFLRCRTGHAALFFIAPAVAAGMTWLTIFPSIVAFCFLAKECL